MKFKKVLTGSALSLALLMSAAPAFAASPTASVENSPISTKADAGINAIKLVQSPNGNFAASFVLDGIKWIFKSKYYDSSKGYWVGIYESVDK
ncbi:MULTISPECIES: antimicrobial peptide LCI [Bacillus]|uniref:antimicrobial peptide LCI n=1 Tax=Bacillus TaxID=1386 RepID=UPI000BA2D041|nr:MULTISPECIES: antimicrobial peptide LCI [Bacillus]MBL4956498.1 antimicrobial peptide LCI [Bacillus velezensis]MBY0031798.1 antimicrobial peptide, Lci [Bacillus velezensis]MBY0044301.1 antimicrobial peptide, Lci [Bacillus velezensis]MCY1638940.1 antimicrobial peptide LCI [Bacillus sp. SL112]PAB02729.1 antimicrobial peptide, Lci [Bacillus velezensis]